MIRLTATIRKALQRRQVIIALDITFLAVAVSSLVYAVVTAPRNGIDLLNYYQSAIEWVAGFSSGAAPTSIYPPFATPIISPLALFSFEQARVLWLGLNLLATGASICLVLSYFNDWPARAKYYLAMLVISWAPFRVTLRVGQVSLIITAFVLGALVARSRNRKFLAGILLGLSLCKFTLSFPFFLYFMWKKEWRVLAAASSLVVVLTGVYAVRLGVSLVDVVRQYVTVLGQLSVSTDVAYVGSTEIKPLLIWLTRGDQGVANVLLVILIIGSLVVLAVIFTRRPQAEPAHFAILSLFGLWAVYHRTYDSVLYILPVTLLIDLLVQRKHVRFSIFWLAATGLLVVSVPGVLMSRLGISEGTLSQTILGFVAIHLERLLTFAMFVSLSFLVWKADPFGSQTRDWDPNHQPPNHRSTPE